ncbi:MAG: nucleotidyltransferase domain-containing protein, partial [Chloroflexota bacterium]
AVLGAADHLLVVAARPAWREALKRIARTLEQAGLAYTLVGSASLAMNGVPLAVRDLDIQVTREGAYRFQELFAGETVIDPVELKESPAVRSYLGHFEIDGQLVEVIGQMERLDGSAWRTAEAHTSRTVDLEGVPVQVAWLEEEALAYIHRRRPERAALCLPYCDPERLAALLQRVAGVADN